VTAIAARFPSLSQTHGLHEEVAIRGDGAGFSSSGACFYRCFIPPDYPLPGLGPGTPHIVRLSMKHADAPNPVGLFCPGRITAN
jgi:hypothetical protein